MKSINDGTINRDKQITSLTPAEKTAGFFVAREALYMVFLNQKSGQQIKSVLLLFYYI